MTGRHRADPAARWWPYCLLCGHPVTRPWWARGPLTPRPLCTDIGACADRFAHTTR